MKANDIFYSLILASHFLSSCWTLFWVYVFLLFSDACFPLFPLFHLTRYLFHMNLQTVVRFEVLKKASWKLVLRAKVQQRRAEKCCQICPKWIKNVIGSSHCDLTPSQRVLSQSHSPPPLFFLSDQSTLSVPLRSIFSGLLPHIGLMEGSF